MEKMKFSSGVEKKKSSVDLISEICEKYNFSQSSEMISLKQEIIASSENSQDKIGEWTDRMQEVIDNLPIGQQDHARAVGQILQLGIYLEVEFIDEAFDLVYDLIDYVSNMKMADILSDLESILAEMELEYP